MLLIITTHTPIAWLVTFDYLDPTTVVASSNLVYVKLGEYFMVKNRVKLKIKAP